ncbi:MAG: diguanylate cyclase [Thermodesulfobacteriota bacterium]
MGKAAKKLLYMEDDPGLARILQKTLGRLGYEVEVAVDGNVGLKMVGRETWDLVITDHEMPECTGMEVIRELAEMEDSPPAIMLTGAGDEKLAVEAMKLGAADYMVKDLEMTYLELLPIIIENALLRANFEKEKEELHRQTVESEERYRLLVDHAPDGIVIQVGGDIAFVNPAAVELFGGVEDKELVGKPILDLVHHNYHHVILGRLKDIFEKQCKMPWVELKMVRLDGMVVDIEVSSVPFIYQGRPAIQSIFRDITERKNSEKRLEYLAHYDALTDLPNRTLFFVRINFLLAQAKRYEHNLALLYLDLDGFKEVNDTHGHAAGDAVLKEAATRIKSILREADTVARMGGDEFAIILDQLKQTSDEKIVARKIIDSVNEPFHYMGQQCNLGVSIGIASYPEDGDDAEVLLHKSDSSMYEAKNRSKNTFVVFGEDEAD